MFTSLTAANFTNLRDPIGAYETAKECLIMGSTKHFRVWNFAKGLMAAPSNFSAWMHVEKPTSPSQGSTKALADKFAHYFTCNTSQNHPPNDPASAALTEIIDEALRDDRSPLNAPFTLEELADAIKAPKCNEMGPDKIH